MKGDFMLLNANKKNDGESRVRDFNGDKDHQPSAEDGTKNIENVEVNNNDENVVSFKWVRKLDTGDATDTKFTCSDTRFFKDFHWFVKTNSKEETAYETSGKYWIDMQLVVDDPEKKTKKCELKLSSGAFRSLASLAVISAAFVASSL